MCIAGTLGNFVRPLRRICPMVAEVRFELTTSGL